jgi:hypothetical protein
MQCMNIIIDKAMIEVHQLSAKALEMMSEADSTYAEAQG